MSNPNPNQQKNEYQKILQKIQSQSKQNKQQRTINILKGQKNKNKSYQQSSYFTYLTKLFQTKKQQTIRYFKVKQIKHTIILSAFLVFSTYLCWVIQRKYDVLQKKAKRTQTYKQRQVEKQNQYIQRMLKKKQFESVPIPNQIQAENDYKYSENSNYASFTIDTKEDLIDLIRKDNKAKQPQQIYEEELKRTRQRI